MWLEHVSYGRVTSDKIVETKYAYHKLEPFISVISLMD